MNQTNPITKPTAHGGGRKFRNDLIFIAAILALVAIGAAALFLLRGQGSTVRVEVDGTVIGTYALSVDREVEIVTGENGEERNLSSSRTARPPSPPPPAPTASAPPTSPSPARGRASFACPIRWSSRSSGGKRHLM